MFHVKYSHKIPNLCHVKHILFINCLVPRATGYIIEELNNNKLKNKETGDLGERIACKYLKSKGLTIVERNYLKKWGEVDIVARETDKVHFVEVKTVSYETKSDLDRAVSHGTWRPEEQVHEFKLHQIHKALETWISENNYAGDWQIDVVAVRVVPREKYAGVNYIENILI